MGRKEVKMRRRMRRGTEMRDGEGTAEDFTGATNSATNIELTSETCTSSHIGVEPPSAGVTFCPYSRQSR